MPKRSRETLPRHRWASWPGATSPRKPTSVQPARHLNFPARSGRLSSEVRLEVPCGYGISVASSDLPTTRVKGLGREAASSRALLRNRHGVRLIATRGSKAMSQWCHEELRVDVSGVHTAAGTAQGECKPECDIGSLGERVGEAALGEDAYGNASRSEAIVLEGDPCVARHGLLSRSDGHRRLVPWTRLRMCRANDWTVLWRAEEMACVSSRTAAWLNGKRVDDSVLLTLRTAARSGLIFWVIYQARRRPAEWNETS
jgi:hypothetical protein